jgi:hypothetical protein
MSAALFGRHIGLAISVAVLIGCVGSSSKDVAKDKQRLQAFILEQAPNDVGNKLDIDFDGKVKLLGCKVEPNGVVRPGSQLKITLYWKSLKKLDAGWNLFTHVLDGAGERILNIDNVGPLREPKDSRQTLAPSYWDPGKVYVDEQVFEVPTSLSTQRLQIVGGIWKGNERLTIVAGPHDSQNRGTFATLTSSVQPATPRPVSVPALRASKIDAAKAPKLDAKLDEEVWKTAASTGPLVNVRTGEKNANFPVNAQVKVLWSTEGAYFGFEVSDPNVVGGFKKEAKDPHLWTKDTVEIMLDPDGDGDNKDYYEIQINPQGLVFDSQFDDYNRPKVEPNGPFGHQDWSSNVKAQVSVDGTLDNAEDKDKGYVIEAFVPWKSFTKGAKVPPEAGSTWRVNFYAMENNGGVAWSPILDQGNFHKASRFGRITWFDPAAVAAPTPAASSSAKSPNAAVQRNTRPHFQMAPLGTRVRLPPPRE